MLVFDWGRVARRSTHQKARIEAAWIFARKTAPACAAEANPLTGKADLSATFQENFGGAKGGRTPDLLNAIQKSSANAA